MYFIELLDLRKPILISFFNGLWLYHLKSGSHLPKIFISFNNSPSKMMKNSFYFILKALFVRKIFKVLSWLFGHVEKTAWLREGCTVKFFFQSISWNTVSGSFHEAWNTFMKYFYFSIQHSLRMFLISKKIVFTKKRYRVKFNRKDIV